MREAASKGPAPGAAGTITPLEGTSSTAASHVGAAATVVVNPGSAGRRATKDVASETTSRCRVFCPT